MRLSGSTTARSVAVIDRGDSEHIQVRITQTRARVRSCAAIRGSIFPRATCSLAALTAKDVEDCRFVGHHADRCRLSFATGEDVERSRNTSPAWAAGSRRSS